MRKQYFKPTLFAERFEVCEHVSSCGPVEGQAGYALHWTKQTCGFCVGGPNDQNVILWTVGLVDKCNVEASAIDPDTNFYDYNGRADMNMDNIFSS